MIKGQVTGRATILATKPVAQEDIIARKGRWPVLVYIFLKADDTRQSHRKRWRADFDIIGGNDIDPVFEYRLDDILPGSSR